MKTLYDILESILDSDEKIEGEYGEDFEAYARYMLFLKCFSDILYKDTPYSRTAISVKFEFSKAMQDEASLNYYTEVEKRLNKYIKLLNKTYKDRYVFSYHRQTANAMMRYYINIKDKKNQVTHKATFKVRNVLDGRCLDIEWGWTKDDFKFMRTEK